MSLKNHLVNLFKGNVKLKDVWYYTQGNVRYKMYYSKFSFLIRKHIMDQINFRISVMKKECYDNGECVMCGCATTALQMCNKACEGKCYPSMMNKKMWNKFKGGELIKIKGIMWRLIDGELYYGEFFLIKKQ